MKNTTMVIAACLMTLGVANTGLASPGKGNSQKAFNQEFKTLLASNPGLRASYDRFKSNSGVRGALAQAIAMTGFAVVSWVMLPASIVTRNWDATAYSAPLALGTGMMSGMFWTEYRTASQAAKTATVREALLSGVAVQGKQLTTEVLKEAEDQVRIARQKVSDTSERDARTRASNQRALETLQTQLANEQANLAKLNGAVGNVAPSRRR